MKNLRLIALLAAAMACAPSATTSTSGSPTPVSNAVKLEPVGYRQQFGTMWTFDAPPTDYWTKTYGWAPDKAWLDNVRLAALRIPGCTASFVSAKGMVLTNHHCVRECVEEVSPKDTNYISEGFAAASTAGEKKCEGMWADQLESIQDVTQRVSAAVRSANPDTAAEQRRVVTEQITKECSDQTKLTCQVVSLYQGGIYSLYRYKRFNDLRLVFAPEDDIASFDVQLTSLKTELSESVEELNERYETLKAAARDRLGSLYNASDYPETLRGLFDVAWDYPSVEPPPYLQQLSPELYRQECQRVAARFDEAVQLAEQAFQEELSQLVSHLTERLSGADDGKPSMPTP